MSVPHRSCTREARSVSVPTHPCIGSAFQRLIYNMTNKKRNENFFISNLSPHRGRAGSSCSNYRLLRG